MNKIIIVKIKTTLFCLSTNMAQHKTGIQFWRVNENNSQEGKKKYKEMKNRKEKQTSRFIQEFHYLNYGISKTRTTMDGENISKIIQQFLITAKDILQIANLLSTHYDK